MERTWYVVAVAKIAVIFRGRFINPRQTFTAYMTDKELENLRESIEILEYRDNKDFPKEQPQATTKSEPIIQENSKGEENDKPSSRTNNNKNKAKVSASKHK